MPLPQIAIEVAPGPEPAVRERPPGKAREALLEACTQAAPAAQCVAADGVRGAIAVALVQWRGQGRFRIEVGARQGQSDPKWAVRELAFSKTDDPLEQWRAVGYAAGTLASEMAKLPGRSTGELESSTATTNPPDPATAAAAGDGRAQPKTRAPEQGPARAPEHADDAATDPKGDAGRRRDGPSGLLRPLPPNWIDAGAFVGPEIDPGGPHVGGFVLGARRFGAAFVSLGLAYASRAPGEDALRVRRLTPSAGGGYTLRLARPLSLDLGGEIVVERLSAQATDEITGRTDEESRWMPGVRARAELAWMPVRSFGIAAGAQATARLARTRVVVGGTNELYAAAVDYDGTVAVRFLF